MSPKDSLPHLTSKDLGLGEKDGIRRRNNSSINVQKMSGLGGLGVILALPSRYFL